MSCPVRGTWVEIIFDEGYRLGLESCPVRGTWVEMNCLTLLINDGAVVPRTGHVG